jgi:two-component system sensor histidine kinase KdpD
MFTKMNKNVWYPVGVVLVVLATLLGHFVRDYFAPENILMIYLLFVTVSAVYGGFGPSVLVSILSVLSFDLFFVPPHFTFAIADTQYILTFVALLSVGIIISYLTSRIRQQNESASRRERETAALYALGRDLVASSNLESYITVIVRRIKETLGINVEIYLPDIQETGKYQAYSESGKIDHAEEDVEAITWSFYHQQAGGYRTGIFPEKKARYLPLFLPPGVLLA